MSDARSGARVDLSDRELALIVRALRRSWARLRVLIAETNDMDGGGYAPDWLIALQVEHGELERRLEDIKLEAGGTRS